MHQSWLPDQNIAVLDTVSLGQKALGSHVGEADSIKVLGLFNFNYGVCLIVALMKISHKTCIAPVKLCEDT